MPTYVITVLEGHGQTDGILQWHNRALRSVARLKRGIDWPIAKTRKCGWAPRPAAQFLSGVLMMTSTSHLATDSGSRSTTDWIQHGDLPRTAACGNGYASAWGSPAMMMMMKWWVIQSSMFQFHCISLCQFCIIRYTVYEITKQALVGEILTKYRVNIR